MSFFHHRGYGVSQSFLVIVIHFTLFVIQTTEGRKNLVYIHVGLRYVLEILRFTPFRSG